MPHVLDLSPVELHSLNFIEFVNLSTKNAPGGTDATEDYVKRKVNNIAFWKRQGDG